MSEQVEDKSLLCAGGWRHRWSAQGLGRDAKLGSTITQPVFRGDTSWNRSGEILSEQYKRLGSDLLQNFFFTSKLRYHFSQYVSWFLIIQVNFLQIDKIIIGVWVNQFLNWIIYVFQVILQILQKFSIILVLFLLFWILKFPSRSKKLKQNLF